MSQRGSTANRLMTSIAAAAFSSRMVTLPAKRVSTRRLPMTSARSSVSSFSCWAVSLGACVLRGEERTGRLVVGLRRGDRHELALRVSQRGQLAAEDAAGVDVGRVVQPLGLGDRGMAVDDHGLAAIVGRPVQADRQPELVGLAGRVAVQGELAHGARAAALHLGLEPGMGDDELAVVEHVVADEAVEP